MKTRHLCIFTTLACLTVSAAIAETGRARAEYDWIKQLQGDWVLAPAERQEGKATGHQLVAPLVGTDTVAMRFKVIGKGSTVQENLLPGTAKEMATMYHCNDVNCQQMEAKHYCVKQNQPQLIAASAVSDNTLVLDCDMQTPLCQSQENHIHRITHQLSADGNHLKTTYISFAEGKYLKDSVYHFDRAQ